MKLGDHKLNTIKLSEDLTPLRASYAVQSTVKHRSTSASEHVGVALTLGRMRLDEDAIVVEEEWVQQLESKNDSVVTKGNIKILNTIESFKTINKNELLNESCLPSLLKACGCEDMGVGEEGEEENLDALTSFFCLCHLDLKTHKVVYWFAFPVLVPVSGKLVQYANTSADADANLSNSMPRPQQVSLKEAWGEDAVADFHKSVHHDLRVQSFLKGLAHPSYFMVILPEDDSEIFVCLPLSKRNYETLTEGDKERCKFAFLDPSSASTNGSEEHIPVGWTLRNLTAYLTLKLGLEGKTIEVISYRPGLIRRISMNHGNGEVSPYRPEGLVENDASLLLRIQLPKKEDYLWPSKTNPQEKEYMCMGWELNARSKPGPRFINLAPLLSQDHLAEQATDLNLKLMKWRMIPDLNLDYLKNMNVLLIGAGTLGCSVARTLLGWGVRRFTFVDNGKVSYSNPVRQNLFEIKDCEGGGKDKAHAAADALKRIAGPTIESEGHVLTIPMPGHAFGAKEEESVRRDTMRLQELMDASDVVFLLTDTRESRWLPTVMARKSNKLMINAALGLDSWLVMRHGGNGADRLGCYFCNDVVAPENSTNNRTLDQQCTVTRPGLAPLASSMAVELCVSLLHHNYRQNAPAPKQNDAGRSSFSPTVQESESTSPLGVMPHQIRGSIVSYTMMTPTVPAFSCCTACADLVIDEYRRSGFEFVRQVCNNSDGSYLEDISGLTAFRAQASTMMEECLDWDDEEDGM